MLVTSAPCRLASRRAASSSSCGPRSLAGVLMRSRPSHTPSTVASARSWSAPSGSFQAAPPRRRCRARLVAAEAIGAETPGHGRQLGILDRLGQMIEARRQHAGASCPSASSGLSMGSLPRASPSPSTTPASPPSAPGSSRCFLPAPLKPCASTQAFCASLSGASRTQPSHRAPARSGIDFVSLPAGTSTAAASEP